MGVAPAPPSRQQRRRGCCCCCRRRPHSRPPRPSLLLLAAAAIALSCLHHPASFSAAAEGGAASTAAAFGGLDRGGGGREHPPRRASICDEHLDMLAPPEVSQLRDLFQDWLRHKRIATDMEALLNNMRRPPEKPEEKHAWTTAWSQEFVSARLNGSQHAAQRTADVVGAVVARLREGGQLRAGTTTEHLLHCSSAHLNPNRYPDRPTVSLMLQYFNRPAVIPFAVELVTACDALVPTELIANVDSPERGAQWAELAWSTAGRVVPVFSYNVHEARAINRMAGLARGRILIVLQDDDSIKPANCSWLPALVRQFDSMPRLGMVGLKSYRRGSGLGNKERFPDSFRLFRDPSTSAFFTFPMHVDYAPLALRRTAFRHVGGVDEGMSDPGMCGICSDWELSIRMWVAGWHVGFMPLVEKGRVDEAEGTTHQPEHVRRCWARQFELGSLVYQGRWGNGWGAGAGRFLEALENEIRIMNLKQLEHTYGSECPFLKGCTDLVGNPPMPPSHRDNYIDPQKPPVNA